MKRAVIHIENGVPRHPDYRMEAPVTLDIYEGEQVAIVGPNGSGKTRLVEILTGRWPLLYGNEVRYDFGDSPHRLVSENIKVMTFRDSYGDSDATYYLQQRWNQHDIDEDVPMVDGKPIISLSSGELRKYQLQKALASQPRLLILDNPFIGLDVEARQQLHDTLERLIRENGLQVILVVSREKDIPDFINRIITRPPLPTPAEFPTPPQKPSSRNLPPQGPSSRILPPQGLASRNLPPQEDYPAASSTLNIPLPAPAESDIDGPSTILQFSHVSIRYGQRTILQDLNWTVHRGEHWALSGANGSGKSTLLSLVCADNPQAYACDIELFGRRRGTGESIWDIKRHIGYVSPEMHRAYLKDLPAIDIVASGLHDSVGLYVRPRPEQRTICLQWMQLFGIAHLADRPFLHMSSGEQRLCLLARAFVKSPDLLILDEPFHGLDDDRRHLATRIIEAYTRHPSVTLIIVSHYPEELPSCITHHLELEKPR